MAYTTLNDLPEILVQNLSGSEYLLTTDSETSYKISFNSINEFLIATSGESFQVMKNKIIDDVTNFVHANAIHYVAKSNVDIPKGTPVKLVQSDTDFIYVDVCSGSEDIVIGVVEDDMIAGELGQIMVSGILDSYDTSSWTEGTLIYAYNGSLTSVQPTSGKIQFVGYVLNSSVDGKILINNSDPYPDARSILFDNSQNLSGVPSRKSTDYSNFRGNLLSTNVQDSITELKHYVDMIYYTETTRLEIGIDSNSGTGTCCAKLPFAPLGQISSCLVFDSVDTINDNVATEYTCYVMLGTNNIDSYVCFHGEDNLCGKYAVVSYLSQAG